MTVRIATLAAVVLCFISCSGSKRPVVYSHPRMSGKAVINGKTAFLLPDDIEIREVVQDYVAAFEGKPADGVEYTLEVLADCLKGNEDLPQPSKHGFATVRRSPFRMTDLGYEDIGRSVKRFFHFEKDKYGIASLKVTSPEELAEALEEADANFLLVFYDIRANRENTTRPTAVYPGVSPSVIPGKQMDLIMMTAQAYVWDRSSRSLFWHGYVAGKCEIDKSVEKDRVRRLSQVFAQDLLEALECE